MVTLTGTTNPGIVHPGVISMKEYIAFTKVPGLEPHNHMEYNVVLRTLDWGGHISLLRSIGLFYNHTK